jgi:hypothetical protein
MERTLSITALALAGIFVACGAHAGSPSDITAGAFQEAAVVAPLVAIGPAYEQGDIVTPPASIDPGMALDPPQTGARMPTIHPPGTRDGKMVLPR